MHFRKFCRLLPTLHSHKIRLKTGIHERVRSHKHFTPSTHFCQRQSYSSAVNTDENVSIFTGTEDRHKGIYVQMTDVDQRRSPAEFSQRLQASISTWQAAGCSSAWLEFPISLSGLIPAAAEAGFVFHHAEGQSCCLYRWLQEDHEDRVPRFASHQCAFERRTVLYVLTGGCVIREDTREVLMVQDKNRPYTLWKFPGGLSELAEDISMTAEREVYEETGIKADFQGILSFRQQHHMSNAFGRSDLFFVCHLKPRTLELNPDYENEIAKCQWMGIQQMLEHPETSKFTRTICNLMEHGLDNGFKKVHFDSKVVESLYRKGQFTMYFHSIDKEAS